MTRIQSAVFSSDRDKKSTHYHDCHQIIFVCRGEVSVSVNGKEHLAREGSLILISRYEDHSIEVLTPFYERYILRLSPSPEGLSDMISDRPEGFSNCIDALSDEGEIRGVCERLVKEWQSTKPYRDEMLDLYTSELFILLERLSPKRESSALVSDIKKRFEKDFHESFTLGALAEEYSVSVSRLSHEFKRVTGRSVMEYLSSTRIAESKRLLSRTDMRVSEIVERCGFSDFSNFSRTFKHNTGLSPLAFRKMYKR